MSNLSNSPDADQTYSDRLICFVDLLGFKATVEESHSDAKVLAALHGALAKLNGQHLADLAHGSIPILTETREISSMLQAGKLQHARQAWPLVVTQFSDSFVLSCPAENHGSCLLLLQTIDHLQNIFFRYLGMLMRGGVSKGALIHIQDGPLFGPAMNSAYALESKAAIYPRVIFDEAAAKHCRQSPSGDHLPLFATFDGHEALDLVSCLAFRAPQEPKDWMEFAEQLVRVKKDIKDPSVFPKIRYLEDRLKQSLPGREAWANACSGATC